MSASCVFAVLPWGLGSDCMQIIEWCSPNKPRLYFTVLSCIMNDACIANRLNHKSVTHSCYDVLVKHLCGAWLHSVIRVMPLYWCVVPKYRWEQLKGDNKTNKQFKLKKNLYLVERVLIMYRCMIFGEFWVCIMQPVCDVSACSAKDSSFISLICGWLCAIFDSFLKKEYNLKCNLPFAFRAQFSRAFWQLNLWWNKI